MPSEWRSILRRRGTRTKTFIARIGEEIVGVATGEQTRIPLMTSAPHIESRLSGKLYELGLLAVHPDHRRKKIGTMLTEKRIEHAKSLKCSAVYSSTYSDNQAKIAQFRRDEFERVHEAPPLRRGVAGRVFFLKHL